jgi:PAS domain S-box-containing protein
MKQLSGVRSIRFKLSMGVLLTTMTALFIAGLILIIYDLGDYRERTVQDLQTQADLIGEASIAALQFDDPGVAQERLALLRIRPNILAAQIRESGNKLFAEYAANGVTTLALAELPSAGKIQVTGSQLILSRQIVSDGNSLGSILIVAAYDFNARLLRDIGIVLAVAILALAISMLISRWIQSRVTRPILSVTELAQQVVDLQNYDLRAVKTTDDEIGYLVDAFNSMLSEIGRRTATLESINRQLGEEIKERAGAETALRATQRRHTALINALTEVIWRADIQGNFLAEEPAWDAYTGQTPETHIGHGWLDAFHSDDRAKLHDFWHTAAVSARSFVEELRLWHVNTRDYRSVHLRAVPIIDDNGHLLEWKGVIEDIHDRVQAVREIRRLNMNLERRVSERTTELENANKELEAFSYSVSHDLRTPLRSIDGFSQALLEDYADVLDESGKDYLARVRSAAQRMGGLIDDLLKLSRVSRAEIECQPLDLSSIASGVVDELRINDPQRKVDIDIAPNLTGYGDPKLIRVALENLLNNAWKYTGKCAEPKIQLGGHNVNGDTGLVIRDNGAGFDMAYAGKLFGAFQRLHDARDFPGTGVGLATVQRIIRRHGGQIWAEAEMNKGAAFYITLPSDKGNPYEH